MLPSPLCRIVCVPRCFFFFFFNDTATTEIYTLSLHDALPIFAEHHGRHADAQADEDEQQHRKIFCEHKVLVPTRDRKSTRLNSSHGYISYAVFCLKKKNMTMPSLPTQPTTSALI